MREGTSGFWVTETDGGIQIGYEDYGVSAFGGGNFERTYTLNKDNAQAFVSALKKEYDGTPLSCDQFFVYRAEKEAAVFLEKQCLFPRAVYYK